MTERRYRAAIMAGLRAAPMLPQELRTALCRHAANPGPLPPWPHPLITVGYRPDWNDTTREPAHDFLDAYQDDLRRTA